jgi:hypothetical protein
MQKSVLQAIKAIFILSLLLISLASCNRQKIVSLKSLLTEMTDRSTLTLYPDPFYKLRQSSSYDRRSVIPDGAGWFSNEDYTQFAGIDSSNGRKEYIMLDTKGPGAIVRWWMTFAGEGSYNGVVRVYVDNMKNPVIEDSVLKVLSGQLLAGEPLSSSVSPRSKLSQRGHNLYLPLPFAEHCMITYECNAVKITPTSRRPSIYYNICYRQYEPGTRVVSISKKELESSKELIGKTNKTLGSLAEENPGNISILRDSLKLSRGDSLTMSVTNKTGAISKISVTLEAENIPQALRSTVLKISFDDLNTVWVPAGEFFGTGYKRTTSSTWESKVSESGEMTSFWLMPFKKSVSVKLINFGSQTVSAKMKVETKDYQWRSSSMYFGASWHEYYNIKSAGAKSVGGTGNHCDINFADIDGKGVYAGDAITVFNTADAWFGEGDEKIFVDGEAFPSSIGTGTEDYYGYAWCLPELFTHPFIAQPSGSGNFTPGLTVNMRYRVLDAIPFRKSISSNIELWHWAPTIINYALTSYWYVFNPYQTNIKPKPWSVTNPVAVKRSDVIKPEVGENGIIEGEDMEVTGSDGGVTETQYITSVGWSNGGQIWWHDAKAGNKLHLKFIMENEGIYNVTGIFTRAVDYGIISFEINGKPAGSLFNGYNPENVRFTDVNLGSWPLKKGENTFTLLIRGADKNAKPGFMAGIDCIKFKPVRN